MSYRNRNNVYDREAFEDYRNSKVYEWDAEEYAEDQLATNDSHIFDLMVDEMAEYLPIALFDGIGEGEDKRSGAEVMAEIRERLVKRIAELDETEEVLTELWWEYDGE